MTTRPDPDAIPDSTVDLIAELANRVHDGDAEGAADLIAALEVDTLRAATAEVVVTRNEDGTLTPEVTREGNRVVPVALDVLLQLVDDLNTARTDLRRLRAGIGDGYGIGDGDGSGW